MLLCCFLLPSITNGQKLLDNHIEAMEQFSKVKSKSKSLASYAKRNLNGTSALDSAELVYMDLKESCDGAISRYKSIIDNPSIAKKTEATITSNLNEMNEELGKFALYVTTKAKSNKEFQQMNPTLLISTFTGLGTSLIKEIGSMQKTKRDAVKKEIDQYKLNEWIEIE
jgi:hypothetical protein